MHPVVRMVAIATVPVWIGLTPESAAAQDFNDRWSIIPKAHADPAPEGLEQVKKDEPQAQPATGQDTLKDARTSNRVFRKGFLLCVFQEQDSERLVIQSESTDGRPSQSTVRHQGPRNPWRKQRHRHHQ